MYSISDTIESSPNLPSKFIKKQYDRFLFFDFFLRSELQFFDLLQCNSNIEYQIEIYYSMNLIFLGSASFKEMWSEKIKQIDKYLCANKEAYGIIVTDSNRDWIIVQNSPINLGLIAFKSSNKNSLTLFNSIGRDWFVSIDDFKMAITDSNSPFHENFDMEFMQNLVVNYG